MEEKVLNSIKENINIDLLYNLCYKGIYKPSINVILYILEEEKTDYLNMIIENNIDNEIEENIIRSIELFCKNNDDNISEIQYDILNCYFESINCYKFEERISILIFNSNNNKLKNFLGIWIGIDEELDKIINNFIIKCKKKEISCCSIQ
jgi:hypothetical protein